MVRMANVLASFDGFNGFEGNDPTNAEEFSNMKPRNCTDKVWLKETPTWEQIEAKKAELEKAEADVKANKVSAYKKLSMTDAEINAIDPTLLGE